MRFTQRQTEVRAIQYKKDNVDEILAWFSDLGVTIRDYVEAEDNLKLRSLSYEIIVESTNFIVYVSSSITVYTKEEFYKNFIPLTSKEKDVNIIDSNDLKDKVSDVEIFGNPDYFQLICKASSKSKGWMKSTKACEIEGLGCFVQVTTQQGDNVAEALTFALNISIVEDENGNKKLVKSV